MIRLSVRLTIGLGLATQALAEPPTGQAHEEPAHVENRVQETDLTTIRLTPAAEKRLGIVTVAVSISDVRRTRTYPGEVVTPPGRSVVVAAPVAGVVLAPDGGIPRAGMAVDDRTPLLLLTPGADGDDRMMAVADRISLARARADVMSARVEAEGQVKQEQVRVEATRIRLERADRLRRESAGSERAYDDAVAESELAHAALDAARNRLAALEQVLKELQTGEHTGIAIPAPLAGLVRVVHVTPGQVVPAGAPLFEVVATNPVWVRVPVYVGDLGRVAMDGPARVRGLADPPGVADQALSRVYPPGSADPAAATVDLFYELPNPDAAFRPGQRVGVVLATTATRQRLVAPRAAILYDIFGGAWVYQETAPQTYVRTRVELVDVLGESAVIARGIAAGALVVTDGAAELFGTEFGAGH